MKRFYCGPIVLIVMLMLASFTAVAQQAEPRFEELPNFHQVNERLFRGGQPKEDGLKKLAQLGIKTIVNLRGESEDTHAEEVEAKGLGMRYFSIPMSGAGRPSDEQIKHVLGLIDTQENTPVFIHCRRGSDRTGAVIAIYRITHDGWTCDQALDEAKRYGMGFVQFRKRDYIKDYFKQQQREKEDKLKERKEAPAP